MKQSRIDFFIEKFKAIPDNKWCTGILKDFYGRHCALGHCGSYSEAGVQVETVESQTLGKLFLEKFNDRCAVANINDGHYSMFIQPTPKARILAALKWLKK